MTLEESFYKAWLETKEKAIQVFSCQTYFANENDRIRFNNAMEFIICETKEAFHKSVFGINQINTESIINCFHQLNGHIQQIKSHTVETYENDSWIDYPISILANIQPYLLDIFKNEFEAKKQNQSIKKVKNISNMLSSVFLRKDAKEQQSEQLYRELTIHNIHTMIEEFQLASIQLMDNQSWYENYLNTQLVYNTIQHSHKRIGLPTKNLGSHRKLNLVISKDFLNDQKWTGIQSKTNASFSIFITPNPLDSAQTWIHEYTHFLDRLAAHVYYQENKTDEELSSFSHIALNAVVNQTPIHNLALNIMAETMSATIGGVSSRDFAEKIQNSIKETKEHITQKIILEILPEKEITWNALEPSERQILLYKTGISEITDFIMLEVSNHPNASFNLNEKDTLISIEGNDTRTSHLFVPDIIHGIYDKVSNLDPYIMHTKLLEYIKENLAQDVTEIMKQHNLYIYKDHSIYDDRFFISPGNEIIRQAQNEQTSNSDVTFSYYDKPLELLARMVESLQTPLMTNIDYQKLTQENKQNSLCPILSREERMLICATIQSLARYVGIDVPNHELEHLPCVTPEKIDENLNLQNSNIADFQYANTNKLIPNETHKKNILTSIFKNRDNLFEIEPVAIPKRKT